MLEATLDAAQRDGVTLVAGRYTLEPATKANMRELPLESGSRPDTNRVKIYTRIPLRGTDPGVTMAADRIKALVKGIPASGRFFIETGTTSLAIDKPEQYCRDVVHHITKEPRPMPKCLALTMVCGATGWMVSCIFSNRARPKCSCISSFLRD